MAATKDGGPSVEQVRENPTFFYGKRVTLTGEVDEVSGAHSFVLEGNDWLFDHEIQVVTRDPVAFAGLPLEDDDDVVVTGTVRPLVIADLERDLGWRLDPAVEVRFRNKPVLVADEIRKVEPTAQWTAKEPKGTVLGTEVLETTREPEKLAGQQVRIRREKVLRLAGKGAWIGSSESHQTFVLPAEGANLGGIKEGDFVEVTGTVRKTPSIADAIKNWDVPAAMRSTVEGEPVYIEATRIASAPAGAAKKK